MIPPVNSLVRYDNPILVATSKGKKGDGPKAPAAVSQTEDILNSILPPRYKPKESHEGLGARGACRLPLMVASAMGLAAGQASSNARLAAARCSAGARPRPQRAAGADADTLIWQGVDRGWAAMGPICVKHACNTSGRDQSAGGARP